jgi:signal transduction histidine kinase
MWFTIETSHPNEKRILPVEAKAQSKWLEYYSFLSPLLSFAVLLAYTYVLFIELPYSGMVIQQDGEVSNVFTDNSFKPPLKPGDKIIQIDQTAWEQINQDLYTPVFQGIEPGQSFPITLLDQNGNAYEIDWQNQTFIKDEFSSRIINQWWFAYFFWGAGTAAYLFVRPKDTRWRLFVLFNYLIAIWLIASSGPSWGHIWGGAIVLRAGIWLTLPVMVHLHWEFPAPLEKVPISLKKIVLALFYIVGIGFALAEIFRIPSLNSYILGLLIAVFASIILLILHYAFQKEERPNITVIGTATLITFLPIFLVGGFVTAGISLPHQAQGLSILGLPLIPGAYFYTIYRKQLGKLEFRANQLIATYLFVILVFSLLIIFLGVFQLTINQENAFIFTLTTSAVIAGLAIYTFDPFQRFVERRILNIPHSPASLLQNFSSMITTSIGVDHLAEVLQNQVLASLLIRQSALIPWKDGKAVGATYLQGIEDRSLPKEGDMPVLLKNAGRLLVSGVQDPLPSHLNWVQVILPLNFNKEVIGFWLLGRRDPDDYYSAAEIEMLQSLANQTAIALVSNQQAQHLRSLYQTNIHRHEMERASLARDLHDDTLNNLAILQQETQDESATEKIQAVIANLREVIRGLRPEMLAYGLATALEDLGDTLNERQKKTKVWVLIKSEPAQFEEEVELHLFRIIQQACENALQHANADRITISGQINPGYVEISIEDNGDGIEGSSEIDFADLLSRGHYGLAGMYERANLIHAQMSIGPAPEKGTKIHLVWKQE